MRTTDGENAEVTTLPREFTEPMFCARVIQVIETTLDMRGKGVNGDPVRRVTQYWTLDGKLLAEVDPWTPERSH